MSTKIWKRCAFVMSVIGVMLALLWVNAAINQSVNDFYFPDSPKYPIGKFRVLISAGTLAVVLSFIAGAVSIIKKEKGWILFISLAFNLIALYVFNAN